MDGRLYELYEKELQFMREMGSEFKHSFPKVGSRLGLETEKCDDPYVERLLEGCLPGRPCAAEDRGRVPKILPATPVHGVPGLPGTLAVHGRGAVQP